MGALALIGVGGSAASAATDAPFVVSRQSESAGGMEVDRDAEASDVSANGRFVVFQSKAENLSPIADNVRTIYRYDTRSKTVELVSRNRGEVADGRSQDPAISANGRYVAYSSEAKNLSPKAGLRPNPTIYVYDARRNRSEPVSRQSASDGGDLANARSSAADISADGRFVSFTTIASNLGGPIETRKNIYIYDRTKKEVRLVSRQSAKDGGRGGNQAAFVSHVSDDGRLVAFTTAATNLGGRPGGIAKSYVYDSRNQRTIPVADDVGRDEVGRDSFYVRVYSISGNGQKVAYYFADSFRNRGAFVEDVGGGHRTRLGRRLDRPRLDRSGDFAVAVEEFHRRLRGQRVTSWRVVRVNVATGRRDVASRPIIRPDGDERKSDAWDPSISSSGQAVSFSSEIASIYEDRKGSRLVFLRRYR